MDRDKLKEYLATRRLGWPYEERYRIESMGDHRFVAKIDDELVGLSYAEIIQPGREARMKMNLKSRYAEFGIGTELLETLMEDLQQSGFEIIRYEISKEYYAYQIYRNLGFEVETQDMEEVKFIWKRSNVEDQDNNFRRLDAAEG